MNRVLYCFWTGPNKISSSRSEALRSMGNSGLEVVLVTEKNLGHFLLPQAPLHPQYHCLSYIHRADYLRTYFMNFHGGAYSDIKFIERSWLDALDRLLGSDKFGIGYREVGVRGVAFTRKVNYIKLVFGWRRLLGNGAYIFKAHSVFTQLWYERMITEMDTLSEELKLNPAMSAEDFRGKAHGTPPCKSSYPLRWSQLLGCIFHPLCLDYHDRLLYSLPAPSFKTFVD